MLRHMPQGLAAVLCLCGVVFAVQEPGIWLDVPFVQQQKDGCGAAVIAMVMQYWNAQQARPPHNDADVAQIQRMLYSRKAHGIYAADMERYFNEHGFRTFAFAGDQNDLRTHLAKGRPLIVALKPKAGETSLHYVIVVGLGTQQDVILLNDPAQKKLLQEDQAKFQKEWKAVANWTLLAVPK